MPSLRFGLPQLLFLFEQQRCRRLRTRMVRCGSPSCLVGCAKLCIRRTTTRYCCLSLVFTKYYWYVHTL